MELKKLQDGISKCSNYSYYLECKIKLNKCLQDIKKAEGSEENEIFGLVNGIINDIMSPEQLISSNVIKVHNFLNNPTPDHDFLAPINSRILKYSNFKSDYPKINDTIQHLKNGYQNSIKQFISNIKDGKINESTFKTRPIIVYEPELEFRDIPLDLGYRMASYDDEANSFIKMNGEGLSRVSRDGNIFYKCAMELQPLTEYAVFQFYSILFGEDHQLISPTQLVFIIRLPTLPQESELRKQIRKLYDEEKSIAAVYQRRPDLKQLIENEKSFEAPIPIQASLAQNGKSLSVFLKELQEEINTDERNFNSIYFERLKELVDLKSFSSHILSSILLVHSDYHQGNLIYDPETKKIIGIDNDRCLESALFTSNGKAISLRFKNILFTFDSLMSEPIDVEVIDQFTIHNPNYFVLEWLVSLYKKESLFIDLIQKAIPSDYQNREKVIQNYFNDKVSIPFRVEYEFISDFLRKFSKMIQILKKKKGKITHHLLFKEILPNVKLLYDKVSQRLPHHQLYNLFTPNESKGIIQEVLDSGVDLKVKEKRTNPLTLKELIIKFISELNVNDLIGQPETFLKFFKLIIKLNNENIINLQQNQLNQSWYTWVQDILFLIIQNEDKNSIQNTLRELLNVLTIKSNSLDLDKNYSIIQYIISNVSDKDRITLSIKLLKEYGASLDNVNQNSSLDSIISRQEFTKEEKLYFIKYLIDVLGAGKANPYSFSLFYKQLSDNIKLEISETIHRLGERDPETLWKLALDHLIPINSNENVDNLIHFPGDETRFISKQFIDIIWDSNSQQLKKKTNIHGTRTVTPITDGIHTLYFKFQPQFPGNELAISSLSQRLFGYCSPYSKFGVFKGIPVLVTQEIKGKNLLEVEKESGSSIISNLEPSNVSKIIITEILINNSDGNLGNYIIGSSKDKDGKEIHKLYSIDNEQVFMPPISIEKRISPLSFSKINSLQVQTVIFFLDQMIQPVHKDVIEGFKNKDLVKDVLEPWVKYLDSENDKWVSFFSDDRNKKPLIDMVKVKKEQKCVIGIAFIPNQLKKLYSKILSLQNLLKKPNVTHWDVLEYLEPHLASKYKTIIKSFPKTATLQQKYSKISNNGSLTSSSFETKDIYNSMDIANSNSFQSDLLSGIYGPKQAIKELNEIIKEHTDIDTIIGGLDKQTETLLGRKFGFNSNRKATISKALVEKLLKHVKLSKLTATQENHLFNLISEYELSNFRIIESNVLDNNKLKTFKFDQIVSLSLIKCNKLLKLSDGNNFLNFKVLKKLRIIHCINLSVIKIETPQLNCLVLPGCIGLKEFDVDAPLLKRIDIQEGSITDIKIENYLKNNFESLIELNISKNKISNIEGFQVKKFIYDEDENIRVSIKKSLNIMAVDSGKLDLAIKLLEVDKRYKSNPIDFFASVNQDVFFRISYFYNILSNPAISCVDRFYQAIFIFDPSNYSYDTLKNTFDIMLSKNFSIRNTTIVFVPIYNFEQNSHGNLNDALKFTKEHENTILFQPNIQNSTADENQLLKLQKSQLFDFIYDNSISFERRFHCQKFKKNNS